MLVLKRCSVLDDPGLHRFHVYGVADEFFSSTLVDDIGLDGAVGCDSVDRDVVSLLSVVPLYGGPPSCRVAGVECDVVAIEYGGLVGAHPSASHVDALVCPAGCAVAFHGDGEHLLALDSVLVGVGDAVDEAPVGADGDVLGGFSRVPFPVARVGGAFRQLWHELDGLSRRYGVGALHDVGVAQSSQLVVVEDLTVVFHFW